jgi:SAM-dependent methyltransferase
LTTRFPPDAEPCPVTDTPSTPSPESAEALAATLARPLIPLGDDDRAIMGKVLERYRSLPVMVWWRVPEMILLNRLSFQWPILDLGCGDGSMAELLFGRERLLTLGLDLSAKDAGRARRRGNFEWVIRGDLCATLPVRSGSFAAVFSNSVFEHVPRVDGLFAEIHRVLRPGGRLVFTVPSEHLNSMLRWPRRIRRVLGRGAAERWQRWWDRRVAHVNLGGEPFWRGLMEEAGLEVLVCRPMLHPGLIESTERWQMLHSVGLGRLNLGTALRLALEGSSHLGWNGPARFLMRRNARRLERLMEREPANPGANLLFVAQRPG